MVMEMPERNVSRKFRSLLEKRLNVYKLIVFGSRTRNTADIDSDLDVVVVLEGAVTKKEKDIVSESAWESGFEDNIVVVPITFSRYEWEQGPEHESMLHKAVEAEGILI